MAASEILFDNRRLQRCYPPADQLYR